MSILFLNIFTLLVLTQSFGSLFHSFIALCVKEYFLVSNLHCSLTNAALCPLVLLPSLSLKKYSYQHPHNRCCSSERRREETPPLFGRITGSDSLDTLVRVGIAKNSGEPQCTMVVLHDFQPCVSNELYVQRGQIVHMLFQVSCMPDAPVCITCTDMSSKVRRFSVKILLFCIYKDVFV